MLAIGLAPFYILVNLYVLIWLFRFIDACFARFHTRGIKVISAAVYILLCTAPASAFLLPSSELKRFAAKIGNDWLGIFLYLFLTILVLDVLRIIIKRMPFMKKSMLRSKKVFVCAGCFVLVLTAGVSIYGMYNARNIRVTRYDVEVDGKAIDKKSLKIVLAADIHLGYNIGERHVEQMVEKINRLEPDIVCIAGDIFDNHYDAIDNPEKIKKTLRRISAPYGVYACYGNHDYEEKILAGFTFSTKNKVSIGAKMRELLRGANIRTLEDEVILVDDSFYLAGRKDYSSKGKAKERRKTPKALLKGIDKSKPVIVIDHQPRELEELAKAGADLDLCGHTHDGQMFPGNIVTGMTWENSCGYMKKGQMHNIVTSGVGIFGPYMRVGTKSEIVEINVSFE